MECRNYAGNCDNLGHRGFTSFTESYRFRALVIGYDVYGCRKLWQNSDISKFRLFIESKSFLDFQALLQTIRFLGPPTDWKFRDTLTVSNFWSQNTRNHLNYQDLPKYRLEHSAWKMIMQLIWLKPITHIKLESQTLYRNHRDILMRLNGCTLDIPGFVSILWYFYPASSISAIEYSRSAPLPYLFSLLCYIDWNTLSNIFPSSKFVARI